MKRRSFFGAIAAAIMGGAAKPEPGWATGGVIKGGDWWRQIPRSHALIRWGDKQTLTEAGFIFDHNDGQCFFSKNSPLMEHLKRAGHRIDEIRVNGVTVASDEIEDTRGHA